MQAVVFDLDGLVVDSEPLAEQAWGRVLSRHGHELDAETISSMVGRPWIDSACLVKERYGPATSVEEIASEESQEFMSLLAGNLRPMPGLSELLAAIDRRGLVRAVATSSGTRYVQLALREIGAADGFAAVVTGDDVPRGKPAPDIYLAAAGALSLPPAACLPLEDSLHGVHAAKAAGMLCVAVPNELTAGLDLSAADQVLPSLTAVKQRLDSLLKPVPR